MGALKAKPEDVRLEQIMVTQVYRVHPGMKLREVAEMFLAHNISGAPVVDAMDRVISVVGEGAVLRLAASAGLEATIAHCMPLLTPASKMITLEKHNTFTEAYRIFLKHNIHRIPIVDSNGVLQGLLSRNMILKLFVEAAHGRAIPGRTK